MPAAAIEQNIAQMIRAIFSGLFFCSQKIFETALLLDMFVGRVGGDSARRRVERVVAGRPVDGGKPVFNDLQAGEGRHRTFPQVGVEFASEILRTSRIDSSPPDRIRYPEAVKRDSKIRMRTVLTSPRHINTASSLANLSLRRKPFRRNVSCGCYCCSRRRGRSGGIFSSFV